MNKETHVLISTWKSLAVSETNSFVKFFILYMCLDAWMTLGAQSSSDMKKRKWLTEEFNTVKSRWESSVQNPEPLFALKAIGRVKDEAPNPPRGHEYAYLRSTSDLKALVEFIYQIRCNLFHGGKSPESANDQLLVKLSAEILSDWITWILDDAQLQSQ